MVVPDVRLLKNMKSQGDLVGRHRWSLSGTASTSVKKINWAKI